MNRTQGGHGELLETKWGSSVFSALAGTTGLNWHPHFGFK